MPGLIRLLLIFYFSKHGQDKICFISISSITDGKGKFCERYLFIREGAAIEKYRRPLGENPARNREKNQ